MTPNGISRALVVLSLCVALGVEGCGTSDATSSGSEGGAAGQDSAAVQYTELRSEVPHDPSPVVADEEYAAVLAATNDIGISLLVTLGDAQQNGVLSPVSLEIALAMATAGAGSTTLQQLVATIGGGVNETNLHAALNRLRNELGARHVPPQTTTVGEQEVEQKLVLHEVDGLWLQEGLDVESAFLDRLSESYDAGVMLIDFANAGAAATVNGWVAENTNGGVVQLVTQQSLADVKVLLTQSLYLLASWARPFDRSLNEMRQFHAVGGEKTVEMVRTVDTLAYGQGEDWQMFDLPYVEGELTFTVLLPEEGSFQVVRDQLDDAWIAGARTSMEPRSIDLSLPLFTIGAEGVPLRLALEQLGLSEPFDCSSGADFSGISAEAQLCLGDLPQAARIGVNEMGTEASAATAVDIVTIGLDDPPEPTVTLVVDRPFMFMVRDASGALLFVGQVTDPKP